MARGDTATYIGFVTESDTRCRSNVIYIKYDVIITPTFADSFENVGLRIRFVPRV